MKKIIITLFLGITFCQLSFGQLSGTYYIPDGSPNYPTITAAIAALNSQGVAAPGVTFKVAAGYTETFSSASAGLITCANSLASSPIIFQKDGTGSNPLITSANGTGTADYVFAIAGTDYVTFDGIDVIDNAAHVTATTQTESGYLLMKAVADTSGTQHATIKNCSISLNRTNTGTVGINLRSWRSDTPGTNRGIKNVLQANSYNSFQGNVITNCFNGIYAMGVASVAPYTNYDQYNDFGSVAGNKISNFGTTTGSPSGFYCQYQNNLTVAKNKISGSVPGGSACYGMQFQSTSNASVYVYGDTVSVQYNGTGVFYGIWETMGTTSTTNIISIHDNVITNCTYPTATSSNCNYLNISHGGPSVSIYNNLVTGNQYGSSTTTSQGAVTYIVTSALPTVLGTSDVYNNTVSNNTRIQSPSGVGGTTTYMQLGIQCYTLNCYGNICDNNTSTTTGTVYGIYCNVNRPITKNFYNNSFTNLSEAKGTTYGINIDAGYNWNIYNNRVQNISGPGTASLITGIYLGNLTGAGSIYIYNNIVGDLKAGTTSSVSAIKGIYLFGFNSISTGLYNNTVYLNSTSIGANFGTTGLMVTKYIQVLDTRNNIIINTSTPNGTGKTIAVLTDSLNFGNLSTTSNNNNYYAGTPSSQRLIFSDGTNSDSTLLQYKIRMSPREYLSVTENTPFISTTTPCDLHVSNAVPSQCESGGSIVAVPMKITTDFDDNPRYPNPGYPVHPTFPANAPDIGADEFGGIPADLTPPLITYSPLANVATTGDRTLVATITDIHGVPVTGTGLPRVCWKKNFGGTWTYVTGTSLGSNQYSFSFGAGTALGDSVYYFILAQDLWASPNVNSFPFAGAAGFTANPPAVATYPSAPASYVIVSSICGTFNVGSGGAYPTLTAAISDINSKGITCPVTLVLTDNAYPAETFPIILEPNGGSSSTNTLTIKPNTGVHPVLADASVSSGLIKVNGFDYLIIDGSVNGGSDKSLTFKNTSETTGAYVIGMFNKGGTDPASHNIIRNSVIKGVSSTTVTNYGILLSSVSGGYDDIVIMDDSICAANTGIQFTGNFSWITTNGQITGNVIGSSNPSDYIVAKGILLQYCDNTLISGNNIMGSEFGNGVPLHGGVYILGYTTFTKIRKNLIHDFYRNVDDGSGAYGIWYQAEGNTETEISDNAIYGIKSSGAAPGVSPNNPYGIYIYSGGNIKIIHNSIYLYGNVLSPTDVRDASSSCIGIYQDGVRSNNIEIRNNILKNSMMGLTGTCPLDGKTYAIATTASNAANFSIIDYNDYYVDGCAHHIGVMNGSTFLSLPDWKAATGQDIHSTGFDPAFTSPTYLLPTSGSFPKAGYYLPSLPSDIAGVLRTDPPDMGAYEFTPGPSLVTNPATGVSATAATLNGIATPAGENLSLYFDYGTSAAYGNTVSGTPSTLTGGTPQPITASLTGLSGNTPYHFRLRAVTFANSIIYGNDMTFTTPGSIPENTTVAGTVSGITDTCYNATNTVTVAGGDDTFVVLNGGSATMVAGQNILYLLGTRVEAGGYMHGYISTGSYCGAKDAPMVDGAGGSQESVPGSQQVNFNIYPNPTTGNFTLVQKTGAQYNNVKIEVFSIRGEKVMTGNMIGEKSHDFRFPDMAAGMYFVKVVADGYVETMKLVKL
ncbi:MAG: T9SS type A sorting domain-containing protein [Bacteroidetes bacterium]|nr:T9SS type A sorting domain-containing protein [Bacteroidota bacterium]